MNYLKSYKKKKNNIKIFKIIVGVFIISMLYEMFGNNKKVLESDISGENNNIEKILEESVKNVVGIAKMDSFTNNQYSWGSGVVISKNGYIVTNEHVISKKDGECFVIVDYNKKLKSKLVWSNADIDLAILKVDYLFENYSALGDSDDINIGENVYAIGNPIGINFYRSITSGIISAKNRNIEFEENDKKLYLNNLIQTDATINEGSSGGALINKNGQLIGINTIKIASAESMNFAIPIDVIKPIIKKLENGEKFKEQTLGILGYDKYTIKETQNNINIDNGIYVAQVNINSESEKSGIKVGDIILSVDNNNVETISKLRAIIYEKDNGAYVNLKIKRLNKEFFVKVKLKDKS